MLVLFSAANARDSKPRFRRPFGPMTSEIVSSVSSLTAARM
ncbi:hypothetical protein [Bradyrhizobium sp. USDA 4369]